MLSRSASASRIPASRPASRRTRTASASIAAKSDRAANPTWNSPIRSRIAVALAVESTDRSWSVGMWFPPQEIRRPRKRDRRSDLGRGAVPRRRCRQHRALRCSAWPILAIPAGVYAKWQIRASFRSTRSSSGARSSAGTRTRRQERTPSANDHLGVAESSPRALRMESSPACSRRPTVRPATTQPHTHRRLGRGHLLLGPCRAEPRRRFHRSEDTALTSCGDRTAAHHQESELRSAPTRGVHDSVSARIAA